MSDTQQLPLSVQPVISYPREAQVGKTYLMTIDLQPSGDGEWLYEEEEYPIYCMLDASPLFSSKPVGEPAVVLHRFGGSYGAAKFLLTAAQEEMEGEIRVTLVNAWGVPVKVLNLVDLRVRQELTRLPSNQVVEIEIKKQEQDNNIDIDSLVYEVRGKIRPLIQERCSMVRVLDMTYPLGLSDIYTNVNILEKITGRRRKDIAELLPESNLEDFDRFGLSRIAEKQMPGLEAVEKYTKLIVLGNPGSGKTTLLKYVAIQCIDGKFQAKRVPIFISLRDFSQAASKMSLLEYISKQFSNNGVTATQITDLFNHSRALVLFDGLDEVREESSHHILKEIRDFSDRFRENYFIITCRFAAREYTLEKFVEVEIADFSDQEIYTFATKWFKDKAETAQIFLTCIEENPPIKEIAINPLLLTLLCLAFEESSYFPANRAEVYKEGLDALLKRWDARRGIQRDEVYKNLSRQRKEELLGKIALATFEQGHYFFKQRAVEQYIADYLRTLPDANSNSEALRLYSEAVLHSIEAQHGLLVERAKEIYSFSHLAFHEYFTAREVVIKAKLEELVEHLTEKRWYEVFLLTTGMMSKADELMWQMKQKIDTFTAANEKLQHFLAWVNQKSRSVRTPYNRAAVRAFYFTLALELSHRNLNIGRNLAPTIDSNVNFSRTSSLNSDLALDRDLCDLLSCALHGGYQLARLRTYVFEFEYTFIKDSNLEQALQTLRNQLAHVRVGMEEYRQGWEVEVQSWAEDLRAVMIEYRNIGNDWQFDDQQKGLLKQYYDANQLLVSCLNSSGQVTPVVRSEIEETLLLPTSLTGTIKITSELVTAPHYTILNEDLYDAPIKTQVTLNLLVSGEISDSGLRLLLRHLYLETQQRNGFEYHNTPTHIFIYAYITKERAESGMGQWIAMLSKIGDAQEPSIQINERQLAQLSAVPKIRFNLSEDTREKIWKELVLVERRARGEVEEQYPLDPTQSLKAGQSLMLSKETPLIPAMSLEDAVSSRQPIQRLPIGSTITVKKVEQRQQTLWYSVDAKSSAGTSLGTGWINSIALIGQSQIDSKQQMQRQAELMQHLEEQYEKELAAKYELTLEQLDEISLEGFQKDWTLPK